MCPTQATLEAYLKSLIALPVKEKVEIVAFFTSDVVRETQKPVVQAGYKEGYLTKRGKNFGGWKTRYFVLQGPSLEYYENVSDPFMNFPPSVDALLPCRRQPVNRVRAPTSGATSFCLFRATAVC